MFDTGPFPIGLLEGSAERVARDLLGALLISTVGGHRTVGRVVETEAYLGPDDPASHAAARIGRTRRNEAMYGPPGTAYVYRIYGLHWCFNVVTGAPGHPAAVLIRAIEPLAGQGTMARRRGRDRDLGSGPGRLCQALCVTGSLDGHDLTRPPLCLCVGVPVPDNGVDVTGRIGIREARDWPLRFLVRGNPHVSGRLR